MEQDDLLEMQMQCCHLPAPTALVFSQHIEDTTTSFRLAPHVLLRCLLPGMPSALFGFHPIGHFSFLECPKFPWSPSLPRCYFPPTVSNIHPHLKVTLPGHLKSAFAKYLNIWTAAFPEESEPEKAEPELKVTEQLA